VHAPRAGFSKKYKKKISKTDAYFEERLRKEILPVGYMTLDNSSLNGNPNGVEQ